MNIKELREKFGLTQVELSQKTGISRDRIAAWEQGRGNPKVQDHEILRKFFEEKVPREATGSPNLALHDDGGGNTYQKKRLEIKNAGGPQVPVFGGFTTLGNIQVYDDGGLKNKIVGYLPAEFFPNCDYAEKAKGDSMYPLIMNQALLIGKTCGLAGITYGEKYIIKTREGMDTTKFIHPGSEPEKLRLKAYNKSIPDQEIEINDIVFVCRVHWIVNPT